MHIIHIEIDQLFDVQLDAYEQESIEYQHEFTIDSELAELEF